MLGTIGLVLAIVGIIFSGIVLFVSDGKFQQAWADGWTLSPTVYLSVASTIVNIALSYTFTVGIEIHWWRVALRPGTTIQRLHDSWSHGNSFLQALTSLRHLNLIAITCIVVTLTPINGPLLQRASQVRLQDHDLTHNVDLCAALQVPRNYTGYLIGRGQLPMFTTEFSDVVRNYTVQRPIPITSPCENTQLQVNDLRSGLGSGLSIKLCTVKHVSTTSQTYVGDWRWLGAALCSSVSERVCLG